MEKQTNATFAFLKLETSTTKQDDCVYSLELPRGRLLKAIYSVLPTLQRILGHFKSSHLCKVEVSILELAPH